MIYVMKRPFLIILMLCLMTISVQVNLSAQLMFDPVALSDDNHYLFNSREIVGGQESNKTLFYGSYQTETIDFQAVTFFPERFFYAPRSKRVFIHNRMGLYYYDLEHEKIITVDQFPNFKTRDEFIIHRMSDVAVSPNYNYALWLVPESPVRGAIYLYDLVRGTSTRIIDDVEIQPGQPAGSWSIDSNYFIYQKNGSIYYFSVMDYFKEKLLTEDWRIIGDTSLNTVYWNRENYLIWIEGNIIYKADPNQFFSRSIYRNYLKQGTVIGKTPFAIDPAFDSFIYNDITKKFIIVKDGSSVYYYSLTYETHENPYLQLNDNMRFDKCDIFDSGEGVLSIKILENGAVNRMLFLLKKRGSSYQFHSFAPVVLSGKQIYGFAKNLSEKQFVVYTDGGAYCFDLSSERLVWKYEEESVTAAISLENDEWLLGGKKLTVQMMPRYNRVRLILASSFDQAGFLPETDEVCITVGNQNYLIDTDNRTIKKYSLYSTKLNTEQKNSRYRLMSRVINKGFYKDIMILKELYSGKLIDITHEPHLRYALFQPDIDLDHTYYDSPLPDKHEIALVFNAISSAEGIFPIVTTLDQMNIPATFFINGTFMEINPVITKEISQFDFEVGNLFQYYVDLTNTDFLINKTFIRQGLSTNEENYFSLTGKNFAPIWHCPMYAYNESIIGYGKEAGYRFVSYNLDSLDWVNKNNRELHESFHMNNASLIERILSKLKPGQIVIFNTGKNNARRDEWLFNDLDLLISELVRAGYSFTTASDLLNKYRK